MPITIRPATVEDAPRLAELGRGFFAFSPFASLAEYEPERAAVGIASLIHTGCGFAAVDGDELVGALIGLLAPLWFAPTARVATEMAWWVAPEHRKGTAGIRLHTAFATWAQAQGATHIAMSDLVIDGDTPAGELIPRLGYTLVERMHVKRIA